MNFVLAVIAAYLIGSIPFSHIFPRLKGHDVRSKGTKNVGATNALVVAGPILGALALIGDTAKGYLVIYLAQTYSGDPWLVAVAGLATIIGHDFSVFLDFKGGKGVATTGGALMAIDPGFAVVTVLFWVLLILISRYFIRSTLIILACVPLAMWVLGMSPALIVYGVGAFILAVIAHREDVRRILAGQELNTSESIKKAFNK
jgi:acyl phosphate:glycerol-3-phosphate acyltransferase